MRKIDDRVRLDLLSTVGTFLLIDHPLVETIQMKRVSARERPSAGGPYFLQTNGAVDAVKVEGRRSDYMSNCSNNNIPPQSYQLTLHPEDYICP